jgi:ribosomal protein S18 acetylase RimI-like enzyme
MPIVIIRAATEADLAGVRACLVETWHASYDAIYGAVEVTRITDSWHAIAVLRSQLADTTNTFLVAEVAGAIVGTALLQVVAADLATLHRLYVRPANQGQLIGAKLLAASLRAVPMAERVRLEVARVNVRAITFYERAGFTRAGTNVAGDTHIYEKLAVTAS